MFLKFCPSRHEPRLLTPPSSKDGRRASRVSARWILMALIDLKTALLALPQAFLH